MSPARADDPLRKVTLNLYEADCQWMERVYGYGWSERVRQLVHNHVWPPHPKTVADLEESTND